jgi:ABC-type multidrug transport system fused ATPase/permease subunit
MSTWFGYLRRGLSRQLPEDRLSGDRAPAGARADLANLRPFLARHWRQGLLGALLVLVNALLAFPLPLLMRTLVDDVILAQQLGLLLPVVGAMVVVVGAGMLATAWQQFYFARFEQDVLLDIQQDLLNRTLRFPKSFFDDQEVGYLMSRLSSDVLGLRWFFSSTLVETLNNGLRLLGGVVLLFYLEWRLALVSLVLVPGLLIWARVFSRRIRALSHQRMEREAHVTRRMQESLAASSLIKAFGSEEREAGRVMGELRSAFGLSLEQTAVGSLAGLSLKVLNQAANLVVLLLGAYWVIVGQWTLGALLAFRSYLGYVYGPALFLAHVNLELQTALAALERVSALYDIVPEETGSGQRVSHLRGEVEFRDVSFAYGDGEPVLQEVSCCIGAGEHVAIVGPSGVGKTTLVSLMLRFYRPTAGEIWFDGRPASDYEVSSLRGRIGYVSQSTLLLSGTVLDNLRYGNPEASEAEVIRAAEIAGIHDFVAGLPEGYDSPVGEGGINLSEGQKQRLAIARALIKEPDILVLDEPTSALDSVIERSILEALPALVRDKTLFVVAHRLSTIQSSDRILLLNENRLVATGTHQSLLESDDFYRAVVSSQQAPAGGTTSGRPPGLAGAGGPGDD